MHVTAPFRCFKTPPCPSQMSILISERAYSLGCGKNDGWTYFPCLPGLVLYMCSIAQSCLTLGGLRNCSPPGSTAHGIFQARILEWVAISSSRGSSRPRDWTYAFCLSSTNRQILYHCTMWEGKIWHPSDFEISPLETWRNFICPSNLYDFHSLCGFL